jgi:hypothetical protein
MRRRGMHFIAIDQGRGMMMTVVMAVMMQVKGMMMNGMRMKVTPIHRLDWWRFLLLMIVTVLLRRRVFLTLIPRGERT